MVHVINGGNVRSSEKRDHQGLSKEDFEKKGKRYARRGQFAEEKFLGTVVVKARERVDKEKRERRSAGAVRGEGDIVAVHRRSETTTWGAGGGVVGRGRKET